MEFPGNEKKKSHIPLNAYGKLIQNQEIPFNGFDTLKNITIFHLAKAQLFHTNLIRKKKKIRKR